MSKKASDWKFSPKQLFAMYWWKDPEWGKANGIIADGSVRSGKTYAFAFGFLFWAHECFSGQTFGCCGKTIASFERNVFGIISTICHCMGWKLEPKRSDHKFIIHYKDGSFNTFYIFGGKDESSQDLIQGVTLAGLLMDEVVLMPESFVAQALARCSVTGSKVWMNCNPGAPGHHIKKNFIDQRHQKGYIYSHFTMEDNLTLSDERRRFYMSQWTGVFYRRYILGEWCAAEGAIYQFFAEHEQEFAIRHIPQDIVRICVGLDYGASKSRCALECIGITRDRKLVALCESHMADVHTPEEIYTFVQKFLDGIPTLIGLNPQTLFCDYGALGQVITKGLKNYLGRHGATVEVKDCKKGEILDRILLTTRLMGEDRFRFSPYVPELVSAFKNALWEEGKVDVRLDNNTSDIDSLDAFEYSFYSFAGSMLS